MEGACCEVRLLRAGAFLCQWDERGGHGNSTDGVQATLSRIAVMQRQFLLVLRLQRVAKYRSLGVKETLGNLCGP